MDNELYIVGLGEALFDLFDNVQRLGGAPLNVAAHACQLGEGADNFIIKSVVASRIGDDKLGKLLNSELKKRNIDTSNLQVDTFLPTGTVKVFSNENGQVDYKIASNVAWDALEYDNKLKLLAKKCSAVCFGTLGQRSLTSRQTIQNFIQASNSAIVMFDVNLRSDNQTPYYSSEVLDTSLKLSSILKLNEQELPIVASLLGIDEAKNLEFNSAITKDAIDSAIYTLIDNYSLDMVVLTQGKLGTKLFMQDKSILTGKPANYSFSKMADSVGAGDSCAAAVLVGLLIGLEPQSIADLANHIGAFVASKAGALPKLPDSILDMVKS